jgi:hypothetical protein
LSGDEAPNPFREHDTSDTSLDTLVKEVLMSKLFGQRLGLVSVAAMVAVSLTFVSAEQEAEIEIDADDIAGVVTGPNGPEAGVWVVAETMDLPTRLIRIVVTDDEGRYLIPDLPEAEYEVFVRGYGLVDSPRADARPGQHLALRAVPAPSAREAEYLMCPRIVV